MARLDKQHRKRDISGFSFYSKYWKAFWRSLFMSQLAIHLNFSNGKVVYSIKVKYGLVDAKGNARYYTPECSTRKKTWTLDLLKRKRLRLKRSPIASEHFLDLSIAKQGKTSTNEWVLGVQGKGCPFLQAITNTISNRKLRLGSKKWHGHGEKGSCKLQRAYDILSHGTAKVCKASRTVVQRLR